MFLFIISLHPCFLTNKQFKYISCSYLSNTDKAVTVLFCIQIHLMFLFIGKSYWMQNVSLDSNTSHVLIYHRPLLKSNFSNLIQIHLMFLFIQRSISIISILENSNTSHVLIYHKIKTFTIRK